VWPLEYQALASNIDNNTRSPQVTTDVVRKPSKLEEHLAVKKAMNEIAAKPKRDALRNKTRKHKAPRAIASKAPTINKLRSPVIPKINLDKKYQRSEKKRVPGKYDHVVLKDDDLFGDQPFENDFDEKDFLPIREDFDQVVSLYRDQDQSLIETVIHYTEDEPPTKIQYVLSNDFMTRLPLVEEVAEPSLPVNIVAFDQVVEKPIASNFDDAFGNFDDPVAIVVIDDQFQFYDSVAAPRVSNVEIKDEVPKLPAPRYPNFSNNNQQ